MKWLAEYCGTSIEMIEKSYGKFMASGGLDPLIRALAMQAPSAHRGEAMREASADGKHRGESRARRGAKTGPPTGPPMAVGSDLNSAPALQKEKWSQGESNN